MDNPPIVADAWLKDLRPLRNARNGAGQSPLRESEAGNASKMVRQPQFPPLRENVLVESANFTCLGYLDRGGTWRDAFRHAEISGVLSWRALGE
jgi:hypothetical protein